MLEPWCRPVGVGIRGSVVGWMFLRRGFVLFFCWGGIDPIKCSKEGSFKWEFSKGTEQKIQLFIHKYHRKTPIIIHIDFTNYCIKAALGP